MIVNLAQAGRSFSVRQSNLRKLLGFGHRHVRTFRDQGIELRNVARGQNFGGERKEKIGIVVASFVGNDCQHARARRDAHQRVLENGAQLIAREVELGRTFSYE